jgi:hypothetical protein
MPFALNEFRGKPMALDLDLGLKLLTEEQRGAIKRMVYVSCVLRKRRGLRLG